MPAAPRPPRGGSGEGASTPTTYATTTPSVYPGSDYSFTLQAVMELKGSVGELKQAVTTLTEASRKHDTKIDSISHKMYAAGVLLTVLLGVAGFLLNKIWDALLTLLKASGH